MFGLCPNILSLSAISFWVFMQSTCSFYTMFLRTSGCMQYLILEFPVVFTDLFRIFVIDVEPMMYVSGAYNVLFIPDFLSNRLQTLVL